MAGHGTYVRGGPRLFRTSRNLYYGRFQAPCSHLAPLVQARRRVLAVVRDTACRLVAIAALALLLNSMFLDGAPHSTQLQYLKYLSTGYHCTCKCSADNAVDRMPTRMSHKDVHTQLRAKAQE